jgi:hypothetical protein
LSTFLGNCRAGARDIEKRGAIFGLYLLAFTQFAQYPASVLLSPMEMRTVAEFCREDLECASMVAALLNRGLIAFSAVPTAIRTRSAECPPAAVVTGRSPRGRDSRQRGKWKNAGERCLGDWTYNRSSPTNTS